MIAFREKEEVLGIYRRHKFVLFLETAPLVFFGLIVCIATAILIGNIQDEFVALSLLIALGGIFLLHVLWIALFIALADHFLDVWILTNVRVIAVEQKGLFSRVISEFELDKIQDATVDVSGFIATFLNYGNLRVRTASEHENFIFKQVWHPNAVKDAIVQASLRFKKGEQLL